MNDFSAQACPEALVWFKRDPIWDPAREDPRFKALMNRLNFGG